MSDEYEIVDEDITREPFEADSKPRLSMEDLELLEGVMPHATRDNHGANHCAEEAPKDDYNFDFEEDSLPQVQDLFPDWRELFRKRPFLQLRRLGDGTPVILIGYGHQERANGSLKLDNSQVDGVLYRNLTSICAPFAKSNDTDSIGWKIKVIRAKEGMKVRCWTNLKTGSDRKDIVRSDWIVAKEGLRPAPKK
jgi:hypothetical protein